MRNLFPVLFPALLILGGCASGMQGKWPTLAPRPGEISADGTALPTCPGCGTDLVARPPVTVTAPQPLPLPADVADRLAATTATIAEVEDKAPAQARRARAAIAAAQSGDVEVERSRFEALFLPLAVAERRLEVLADDVAGRNGAEAVLVRNGELRARLASLETLRGSVGE